MKLSKFNNTVKHEDVSYIYNSFSDQFIALDPTLKLMYETLTSESEIAELAGIHPTFYQSLERNGFIINQEENEIEKLKKLSREIDNDKTHFTLVINPTMNCNFKCWYCYETHEKGSKMTEETVQNVCTFISHMIEDNPELQSLNISWFGGEPMLYFSNVIAPIMEFAAPYCEDHGIYLNFQFTTNGYLFNDQMIERLKKFNISGFQITLDGSKTNHDLVRFVNASKGSYDTIIENIRKLCENDLRVAIRVNYTARNLDNFEEVFDDFNAISTSKRDYATVSFHKVWQEKECQITEKRVQELIQKIKAFGLRSDVGAVPDNVRNSCYADKVNSATINYNGNIYKCTARNFSAESREGVLNKDGYIEWSDAVKERMNIKFKNRPCLECSIMPLCNGGCSQHALEHKDEDYCVYDFDENQKKDIILKKLTALVA